MDFLDIFDLTTSTSENATIGLLVGIEPDLVIPVQRRSNRTTQFLGNTVRRVGFCINPTVYPSTTLLKEPILAIP